MRKLPVWSKAALVAGMFAYGLFAVAVIMPLLHRVAGRHAERAFEPIRAGWCRTLCRILGVSLEIAGEPSPDARLLVANHVSWLDILVLGASGPMVFVAKEEVSDWPVMGYLARHVGTLFVRRGDAEQTAVTAERMAWTLRQGKRLMLFPEGTTTAGDKVLRFHARLLAPAQLAHVPVQAVAIEYLGDARNVAPFIGEDEFLPHLLRVLMLESIAMRMHYCPVLPAGIPRDTLAQTARRQVAGALFGVAEAKVGAGR
ncbi:1-acyl-sn-glycerol-3-phosphate acyltransferase [Methylococcus sp. EFPC2]|uniref:lysophospholipid acyltransferase family protein n=1 Tax=Methylococcus sp. EFPC2 TaxID=2812648 RepID=UPI0019689953|nr:lysophospholipid acyltransferase family protein [Methylococcus sp. EFPC2]QSA96342.1 1-acyl-sn-glycerol-3-phosphate acyltransferase [Methylococcus sp. EFPC2]